MPRCSFSGDEVQKGTGLMYVKKDGTVYYFCSCKCKKNFLKLKSEGRKKKWTISFKEFKERQGARKPQETTVKSKSSKKK